MSKRVKVKKFKCHAVFCTRNRNHYCATPLSDMDCDEKHNHVYIEIKRSEYNKLQLLWHAAKTSWPETMRAAEALDKEYSKK